MRCGPTPDPATAGLAILAQSGDGGLRRGTDAGQKKGALARPEESVLSPHGLAAAERDREVAAKLQATARADTEKLRLANKELAREKARLEQEVAELTDKLESPEDVWRPGGAAPQSSVASGPARTDRSLAHALLIWLATLILFGLCIYLGMEALRR